MSQTDCRTPRDRGRELRSRLHAVALTSGILLVMGVTVATAAPTSSHEDATVIRGAVLAASPRSAPMSPAATVTFPSGRAPALPSGRPATTTVTESGPSSLDTCAAAMAYVSIHAAPGFIATCASHSADGRYGETCLHVRDHCPGSEWVHIACPLPFVYMNESFNTHRWTGGSAPDDGVWHPPIDPYGQGTSSEDAYCNSRR